MAHAHSEIIIKIMNPLAQLYKILKITFSSLITNQMCVAAFVRHDRSEQNDLGLQIHHLHNSRCLEI